MPTWIRVDHGIKTDPKMADFAAALNISREAAVGLVVNLWLELAEHAKDGRIGDVNDAVLEDWACWRGRAGRFAAVFRRIFQRTDGALNAWDKHNGRAIARAEKNAERSRLWRQQQEEKHRGRMRSRTRSRTHTGSVRESSPNDSRTVRERVTRRTSRPHPIPTQGDGVLEEIPVPPPDARLGGAIRPAAGRDDVVIPLPSPQVVAERQREWKAGLATLSGQP